MAEQSHGATVAETGPPVLSHGVLGWMRANLFNSIPNAIVTILLGALLLQITVGLINWLFLDAVWGERDPVTGALSADACRAAGGFCYAFIREKARLILFGTYPSAEQWRPLIAVLLFVTMLLVSCNRLAWKPWLALAWAVALVVLGVLMWGGSFGLTYVPNTNWGGLPLTLMLSVIGLVVAFPLSILLALGRRSDMPAAKTLCVGYIEIIRGVPLITVLFMASVLFPLFLPTGVTIDKLLRAQIAMIIFSAAYLAEVVRGGLQAIPSGQYEAADSLGLGYWSKMRLIILPQALKISIPPMVNTFIGFFKDTSLVIIIGLFDLLGTAKASLTDPAWRGFYKEAYLFIAVLYFAFCFFMSRYSQYLERRLNTGHRR